MTDKKLHKISDKAAAWLAGWWFSDTVARGLGEPTPAQQREFERQIQQSMRQKNRSQRRPGLRKMGPYVQTERNDTYFRKIPVENAVQAELLKFAIGNQRLSVPPFQGARFDPTSHRWVKPENLGNTYAARGGRKRIRGSGTGVHQRTVGGHGKGFGRGYRRGIRGREAEQTRRTRIAEAAKQHKRASKRRGRIKKSADQLALGEYYFLLKATNEAKEFQEYADAALLPTARQSQKVEFNNLRRNPDLISPDTPEGAHNQRYQNVVDAFWAVHKNKREIDGAASPQEKQIATKNYKENIDKLKDATYAFNSGHNSIGDFIDGNHDNHLYSHVHHSIGKAPFAEHYNSHIRSLPEHAVYASAYTPPKGVKTYKTEHGATYWFPEKLGYDKDKLQGDMTDKKDPRARPGLSDKVAEGQTILPEQAESKRGAADRRAAEEQLAADDEYEKWRIPEGDKAKETQEAYKLGIEEARKNYPNPLIFNKGKRNEYMYFGQTDYFPLQEDIDSGKTDLDYVRAPHGPGLVKYRSGNITSGMWRKGELLNGAHAVNPTNKKTGGPGIGNDRISHEKATIDSRLTGLGNLANNPLASNIPSNIISDILNVSAAKRRQILSGIKPKISEDDFNLSVDMQKEYNPLVGIDVLLKHHIEKFKKS